MKNRELAFSAFDYKNMWKSFQEKYGHLETDIYDDLTMSIKQLMEDYEEEYYQDNKNKLDVEEYYKD